MPSQTFLSCDWGTSHLRLRLVETATLAVLAESKSSEGVAQVAQSGGTEGRAERFADILQNHARELFRQAGVTSDICVVSGMASSSIGWTELPYASAPLDLSSENLITHRVSVSDLTVVLVSGVCTGDDVMRGEECELLGLSALQPALTAAPSCLILPGTHSKHLQLDGNRLTSFTTFMTGEIYAQLLQTPTLKAALVGTAQTSHPEFLAGVAAVQQSGLLAALFKIRARGLLCDRGDLHGPSFLSGVLIGSELMDLSANRSVFLAGMAPLGELYALAAEALKIPLNIISPDILPLALLQAHRDLLSC